MSNLGEISKEMQSPLQQNPNTWLFPQREMVPRRLRFYKTSDRFRQEKAVNLV